MIGSNETSPYCSFRIRLTIKFSSLASYEEISYLFDVWQMMDIFSFIVVFLSGYLIVLSLFIEVNISILHLPPPVFPRPQPCTMSLWTTNNEGQPTTGPSLLWIKTMRKQGNMLTGCRVSLCVPPLLHTVTPAGSNISISFKSDHN